MRVQEKIVSIVSDINKGVYDKERELKMALLAAVAGESILLLGPPGVAKSMIARSIKNVFENAHSFEYLMSRFSTPDEIFGPVSIVKLKDSGHYERLTDGYLPDADVVFLDEIWKAGPAIQNTLLTVLNEKLFRNGNYEMHLPLKLLVAASNELPAKGEGLEDLWDRFLIRLVSKSIQDEEEFYKMLLDNKDTSGNINTPITQVEYNEWQKDIDKVEISNAILQAITYIRERIKDIPVDDSDLRKSIYISDRRWKKIIRLLRTEAYIQGRSYVSLSDLYIIQHCIWNNPEEYEDVKNIVCDALIYPIENKVKIINKTLNDDIKALYLREAMEKVLYKDIDKKLRIYDNGYFYVKNHDRGNTYIYMYDYLNLSYDWTNTEAAMIFPAANQINKLLIHCVKGVGANVTNNNNYNGRTDVKLYRGEGCLFINGVRYELEQVEENELEANMLCEIKLSNTDYLDTFDKIKKELDTLEKLVVDNLFIAKDDINGFIGKIMRLRNNLEMMRVDHMKLQQV